MSGHAEPADQQSAYQAGSRPNVSAAYGAEQRERRTYGADPVGEHVRGVGSAGALLALSGPTAAAGPDLVVTNPTSPFAQISYLTNASQL